MTQQHSVFKKVLPYAIGFVVIAVASGTAAGYLKAHRAPEQAACTDEALLCPDGSGVGRTGPMCSFAPCGALASATGTLVSTSAGYFLSMTAPDAGYTLPLFAPPNIDLASRVGSVVTVHGAFQAGNRYFVESLVPASK